MLVHAPYRFWHLALAPHLVALFLAGLLFLLAFPAPLRPGSLLFLQSDEPSKSSIVVAAPSTPNQFPLTPVNVHVHSLGHPLDLDVTVESTSRSKANFDDLPPDDYVILVSAANLAPAKLNVSLPPGQVLELALDISLGFPSALTLKPFRTSPQPQPPPSPTNSLLELHPADPAPPPSPAPSKGWAPADVGEYSPLVDQSPSCNLDTLLPHASQRLEEFVDNVNRISATEVLEHELLDKKGKPLEHVRRKFNFVALVQNVPPYGLSVEEYRDGLFGSIPFPGNVATVGMPSLALIFHPFYIHGFEMTCEGLASWQGRSAWQVFFKQRSEGAAHMSAYRLNGKSFPVLLKGRAWIDSENFQLLHLDTDLLEPIVPVKLFFQHQALDYGPVQLTERNLYLWLPQRAEIFLDSGGHHVHHVHSYSDYQLFSIGYGQKIAAPKEPPPEN
jgi:hypothetical protein